MSGPYRVGDPAIYCSYSPISRSVHLRQVEVKSITAVDGGYSVTIGLRLMRPGSDRKPNVTGPPGRSEFETRRPGPHRRRPQIEGEVIERPTILVNEHGVGLGLMPADSRVLQSLSAGALHMAIQTQVAAALVGPYGDRELLTHEEAADYLRMGPQSLYTLNKEGTGPRYVTGGKRNLYPMWCLRQWVLERLTPIGGPADRVRPRREIETPPDLAGPT